MTGAFCMGPVMTIGAIAATYLSIWAIALFLAVSWNRWMAKGARTGVEGAETGAPLMPLMIGTSFAAAILTGAVVYLKTVSG